MIRKLSVLLTIVVVIGLAIALSRCGKKSALDAPPKSSALVSETRIG